MHGEHLVVLVGTKDGSVWCRQLKTNKKSFNSADNEEEHGDNAVHDSDLLMVNSKEPFLPALCFHWALNRTH